tara:strand:- start:93 stop:293 length:201 start_codon:yes stop_codon:yes gene_type:complete
MAKEQKKEKDTNKIALSTFVGQIMNPATDKWVIKKKFVNDKELKTKAEWIKLVKRHLQGIDIKINT